MITTTPIVPSEWTMERQTGALGRLLASETPPTAGRHTRDWTRNSSSSSSSADEAEAAAKAAGGEEERTRFTMKKVGGPWPGAGVACVLHGRCRRWPKRCAMCSSFSGLLNVLLAAQCLRFPYGSKPPDNVSIFG